MKKYLLNLLIILVISLQSSCGFRPNYKLDSGEREFLSNIEVAPIETIEGIEFYNHIKELFPPEKDTKYILKTSFSFSKLYHILQLNSDIFREVQNINVTYQLIDKKSLHILTKGHFSKMNSHNISDLLYSNTVIKQEAIYDLAKNSAEEIRNRLIIFYLTSP